MEQIFYLICGYGVAMIIYGILCKFDLIITPQSLSKTLNSFGDKIVGEIKDYINTCDYARNKDLINCKFICGEQNEKKYASWQAFDELKETVKEIKEKKQSKKIN